MESKSFNTGVPQFDGTEYLIWSSLTEAVLIAKGIGHVISEESPSVEDDKGSLAKFQKQDREARAYILLSLDREILKGVVHLKTSKTLWLKLKQMHHLKSESNKIQLQAEFFDLRMQPGQKINEYVSKVEYIAAQLKDFGEEFRDSQIISKIVSGLPTEYKHFMSSWLGTTEEERTFDKLLSRLLAEESILLQAESQDTVALNMRAGYNKKSYEKIRPKRNKKDIECFYCHKKGHIKKECRLRIKEEREGKIPDKSIAMAARVLNAGGQRGGDENSWYLDSGASAHMSKHRNEYIYAHGNGTIETLSQLGGNKLKVLIEQAMYVPDISDNLFSQGAADAKGLQFTSSNGRLSILHQGITVVTGRKEHGNLYKLNLEVIHEAKIAKTERTIEEWHEVLGHADVTKIQQMENEGCVDGLKIVAKPKQTNDCGDCQFGKGHRSSHPTSERTRSTEILHRIHTDLVGPIEPNSVSGYKYFMLIRDKYSTYLFVRFLSTKAHVLMTLKKFIDEVAIETQKRIQIIRSDNGTEFKNQGMSCLCAKEGIIQEFSAPRTPQQNGEIERANRTIIETARAMLQASKLNLFLALNFN